MAEGRVRMPIKPTFHRAIRNLCDELILRALSHADELLPGVADQLGRGLANELRDAAQPVGTSPLLTFTHNEPAVNLYSAGGSFAPHRDLQSLTVLVPLVDPDAFEGGGTAFWRSVPVAESDGPLPPGELVQRDVDASPPAVVLAPPQGTALLWSGDVTHAGQALAGGIRSVFVASFSRRRCNDQG